MRVPIGEQLFLTFAAYKGALSASLYLVNLQMVEALDVSDEVVFFLGFSRGASQVVAVVVFTTVGIDSVARGFFG